MIAIVNTPGTNVDAMFAEAMRAIGAKRPQEIDPECVKVSNADLVFPAENVVAEVKTLTNDPRGSKDFQNKVSAVWDRWVAQGRVPQPTTEPLRSTVKTCLLSYYVIWRLWLRAWCVSVFKRPMAKSRP